MIDSAAGVRAGARKAEVGKDAGRGGGGEAAEGADG
jgi:hypothetical protein